MLKDPKMTLWAYAQGPKKWPLERTLKDPKHEPLSVRSIAVWAYAQLLFEHTLKDPKNVLRAYAQGHILVVPFNPEKLLSYEEALFC